MLSHLKRHACSRRMSVQWQLSMVATQCRYVLSDNHAVRQYALKKYGSKVLTAVEARLEHSANKEGRDDAHALSVEGMRTAIGEHHAFGLTDFQIVSHNSGFGRTAAFRSLRTKFSLYTVGVPDPTTGNAAVMPMDCSLAGHTTLDAASRHFSGI